MCEFLSQLMNQNMALIFELQKCAGFFSNPYRRLPILIIQCSLIILINRLLFRNVSGLHYFLVTVGSVGSLKEFRKWTCNNPG